MYDVLSATIEKVDTSEHVSNYEMRQRNIMASTQKGASRRGSSFGRMQVAAPSRDFRRTLSTPEDISPLKSKLARTSANRIAARRSSAMATSTRKSSLGGKDFK
jgi:hypothetical protein